MSHTPLAGPASNTQDWYDYRSRGFGASEAAAAAGLSEYQTPFGLYCQKLGLLPPFEGNEATRRGKRVEHLIVEDWEEKNGRKVELYPAPMFVHPNPKRSFMFATPDAIVDMASKGLECKNTNFRQAKKLGEEHGSTVLPEWQSQCQHQMEVMGWETVDVAVWVELEYLQFTVIRDDEFIEMMISAQEELWQRIEAEDPPDIDWQHKTTPDLIRNLYNTVDGTVKDLSYDAAMAWALQEQLGDQMKELKAQWEAARAKVLYEMEDAAIGRLPGNLPSDLKREIVRLNVPDTPSRRGHIRLYDRKATTDGAN
jgi:putative phage-type endonuclease